MGMESDVNMISDTFQSNIDFIKGFKGKYPGFVNCDIVRKDIMLTTNNLCVTFMDSVYDFTMEILHLTVIWILLCISLYANGFYPAMTNWDKKPDRLRNLDLDNSEIEIELSDPNESSVNIRL